MVDVRADALQFSLVSHDPFEIIALQAGRTRLFSAAFYTQGNGRFERPDNGRDRPGHRFAELFSVGWGTAGRGTAG